MRKYSSRELGDAEGSVRTSLGVRSRGSVQDVIEVGLCRRMNRSMPAVTRKGRCGWKRAVLTIESWPVAEGTCYKMTHMEEKHDIPVRRARGVERSTGTYL